MMKREYEKELPMKNFIGETIRVLLAIDEYTENNRTAILLYIYDEEEQFYDSFGVMTVNLPDAFCPDKDSKTAFAYVDINNYSHIEEFIEENQLGQKLPFTQTSGRCRYPLFALHLSEIKKHLIDFKNE